MSIKPKPILFVTSSPTIPEEPCVWKNKPFPKCSNSFSNAFPNLNFYFTNNWVYTFNPEGESFNHKSQNTSIKEQENSFSSKISNSFLFIILSSIISFIHNVYLIDSKVFYNLSLIFLISEIILSGMSAVTKIKLSQNKSFLTTVFYLSTISNYILHIYRFVTIL